VRNKLPPFSPKAAGHPNDSDVREAAVLMAFTRQEDPTVVFIRRAEHVNSHSGQVAFPGGMWEPQDKNLLETALRESEEEIALPRTEVEVISVLKPRRTRYSVRVTPFVGFIPQGLEFIPEEAELDAVFEVPLGYLLAPENYRRAVFETSAGDYEAPCIFYRDYRIWGFTFGVLMDVLTDVFDFTVPVSMDYRMTENVNG
jgi:8-oxo-dGTP pyrophosphatase MutT (NUDIX family)